jgi:nucleoside 2-deoxyribosyltransferase
MVDVRNNLQARGVLCDWPTPEARRDPRRMTVEESRKAIALHLERMNGADAILIFNKDGYLGTSVMMEIGYARAKQKPMYALDPIEDRFVMSLVTLVGSIDEFLELARA